MGKKEMINTVSCNVEIEFDVSEIKDIMSKDEKIKKEILKRLMNAINEIDIDDVAYEIQTFIGEIIKDIVRDIVKKESSMIEDIIKNELKIIVAPIRKLIANMIKDGSIADGENDE